MPVEIRKEGILNRMSPDDVTKILNLQPELLHNGIFPWKGVWYDTEGNQRGLVPPPEPELSSKFQMAAVEAAFGDTSFSDHWMRLNDHIKGNRGRVSQAAPARLTPSQLMEDTRVGLQRIQRQAMKADPKLQAEYERTAFDVFRKNPVLKPEIDSFLSVNVDSIKPDIDQAANEAALKETRARERSLYKAFTERLSGRFDQYYPSHEAGVFLPEDRAYELAAKFDPSEFNEGFSAVAFKGILNKAQLPGDQGVNAAKTFGTLLGN